MSKSLAELIEAGNFKDASSLFDECNRHLWIPPIGNEVRGALMTVNLTITLFDRQDVLAYIVDKFSRKTANRIHFATAYELAAFAAKKGRKGWNGRDKVIAFGSKIGREAVPVLEFQAGLGRFLKTEAPERGYWRGWPTVLCVRI